MSPKPKSAPHRVLLSLPTGLYETVSRLSAAMEKPRAELIRDMLADQQAILNAMADALEQAKAGHKEQAMKGLTQMTGEALKKVGEVFAPEKGKRRKHGK
jgi:metal-responsive CopG/Arc/MetJ family transcriptional regulator